MVSLVYTHLDLSPWVSQPQHPSSTSHSIGDTSVVGEAQASPRFALRLGQEQQHSGMGFTIWGLCYFLGV